MLAIFLKGFHKHVSFKQPAQVIDFIIAKSFTLCVQALDIPCNKLALKLQNHFENKGFTSFNLKDSSTTDLLNRTSVERAMNWIEGYRQKLILDLLRFYLFDFLYNLAGILAVQNPDIVDRVLHRRQGR